jgi:penicillin-insensitive murein endopeptidase
MSAMSCFTDRLRSRCRSPASRLLLVLCAVAGLLADPAAAADGMPWVDLKTPYPGPAGSIGTYTNGCVAGAKALPADGVGYQVIRLGRRRYFGHPMLVDYIQRFGQRMHAAGLPPALIGDMGLVRGGRTPDSHMSHQTGLDVDIWLRLDLPRMPPKEREDLSAIVMVDSSGKHVDPLHWTADQARMLKLAAADRRVERIFVNPAIKLALCQSQWPDRSWLGKIRPWYGHRSHFHVRLACPPGSPGCKPQAPPPPGDGCGKDLMWWFEPREPVKPGPEKAPPPIPTACRPILLSPDAPSDAAG